MNIHVALFVIILTCVASGLFLRAVVLALDANPGVGAIACAIVIAAALRGILNE